MRERDPPAMHILAVSLLALLPSIGMASATSSATLHNLMITLTDLNPSDGVTPTISFFPTNPSVGSNVSVGVGSSPGASSSSPVAFGPVEASLERPFSRGSGRVWGDSVLEGGVSATAEGAALAQSSWSEYNVQAAPGYFLQFLLSPYTQVVFSAMANVSARTEPEIQSNSSFSGAPEEATATVNFNISPISSWAGPQNQTLSVNAFTTTTRDTQTGLWTYAGASLSQLGVPLSIALVNDTSAVQGARFSASARAYGRDGLVTVVPEPSSYALLLVGLATGLLVKRRWH